MKFFFVCGAALLSALIFSPVAKAGLVAQPPVELTGTKGKFDFIKTDGRRLLACHTGNGSLDIIDLDSSKLIKSVPTGAAQGVAIDAKGGRYFVSVSKPAKLVIIDSTKLEITGEVPLPGPADLVVYSSELNRVFVDNDEKPEMWAIDPEAKAITSTQTFPGTGMEDLAVDSSGKKLIQDLKDTSQLASFYPAEKDWPGPWSTLPAEKPHGLAILNNDTVLIAGGNGKLVLLNYKSGEIIASCDIALHVDEIAYDPGTNQAYCASGQGFISVVMVFEKKLAMREAVPSSAGAHSIAVDPQTHAVWIAYAKDNKAYVQQFLAK